MLKGVRSKVKQKLAKQEQEVCCPERDCYHGKCLCHPFCLYNQGSISTMIIPSGNFGMRYDSLSWSLSLACGSTRSRAWW